MKNYLFLATIIFIFSCSGDLKKENKQLKEQLATIQKMAEDQAALAQEAAAEARIQEQLAKETAEAALELSNCANPKEHMDLKTQLNKAQLELSKQLQIIDEQIKLVEAAQLEAEKEAEIAKRQTLLANEQKLKAEKQAALVNQLKTKAASAEEELTYMQKELEEAKKALEASK